MKLAMFREGGRDRLGVVEADTVIDVTAGLPALSADLADWLPGQGTSWRMLALLAREATARLPLSAVRLLPPLRRPSAFLAIGGNYASHLREIAHLNVSAGEHQIWFNKQASCITGPFDELVIPRHVDAGLRGGTGGGHRPALPQRAGARRHRLHRRIHHLQ